MLIPFFGMATYLFAKLELGTHIMNDRILKLIHGFKLFGVSVGNEHKAAHSVVHKADVHALFCFSC